MHQKSYPTKEEIQSAGDHRLLSNEVFEVFSNWKKEVWIRRLDDQTAIDALFSHLDAIYLKHPVVIFRPDSSLSSNFNPRTNTITMNGKPSIITALHEYAHALGEDEFGACVYSFQLFSAVFPKAYAKLKWCGHMLVKP